MPLLKHARKKQRQDKKRTLANKRIKDLYKLLLKKAKANPTKEAISSAFKSIDKAAKADVIHENKAARLKSSLSKLSNGQTSTKAASSETQMKEQKKATSPKKTGKKSSAKAAKAAKSAA
jgi:small subunit ribosomal protein S20